MPAIWTSSRTRSGSSATTRSSASGPDEAESTEKPAGSRIASSSRTFAGMSSTTRTRGVGSLSALISLAQEAPHLVGKLAHADRLCEVTVEALGEEPLLVAAHRRRRQGHDGDPAGPRVLLEQLESRRAADVRHPDVHEDERGEVLLRERDAFEAARCLEGVEAGELEHVAGELPVVLVVVDDQDQLTHGSSCRIGRVKRKVLPWPRVLSAQSRPPWSSTSLRESGSPSPVPSACFPSLACSNCSKIVSSSSAAIPGPVSATATSTCPSVVRAEMSIRPSAGGELDGVGEEVEDDLADAA